MIARLEMWGAVLLAVLGGVAVAVLWGYSKGKSHAANKIKAAQQKLVDAKAVNEANEVRHDVEMETSRMPDKGRQKVANAAPDTAAGKLCADGWLRDDPGAKPKS